MARGLLIALLAFAAAPLAGCGFQPLYARQGVVQKLAAIDVVAPEGRTGFLLRQHLDDAFVKKAGEAPAYRMTMQLAEVRVPRGTRVDAVATRYEYSLTANYALTDAASGAVAKTGSVHVEITYDSADQPYAAVAAQLDAQDRAAQEAARRIQLQLASWLATGKPS